MAVVALLAATLAPASAQAGSTPKFRVQPSVQQVAGRGAPPGETAALRDANGTEVATDTVDAFGSALFRDVPTGDGYVVRVGDTTSDPVTVLDPATAPAQSLYSGLELRPGYGYLKTRDGTL